MKRILITGSRNWPSRAMVYTAIHTAMSHLGSTEEFTLVTGACPTGADKIAEEIGKELGMTIERHIPDWSVGKRGGYVRNLKMVSLGADICLAFIRDNSRGATMTLELAEKARIPCVAHYIKTPGR